METSYRNASRSYYEFQQFYEALLNSCPHTIIPALPLAQTSAPTDEEDDRLVRIMLQRWLTRICEDPIVMHDEDLRSFIASEFGYQPILRPRRKTGSGFSLIKRGVPDEDEVLQRARFELTKLETQFFDAAKAIDKLAVARRSECWSVFVNVMLITVGQTYRPHTPKWVTSLLMLPQPRPIPHLLMLCGSWGGHGTACLILIKRNPSASVSSSVIRLAIKV